MLLNICYIYNKKYAAITLRCSDSQTQNLLQYSLAGFIDLFIYTVLIERLIHNSMCSKGLGIRSLFVLYIFKIFYLYCLFSCHENYFLL